MTRFIIFVLLLGVHFARGATEDVMKLMINVRARLSVRPEGIVSKCAIETNQGEKLEYEQISDPIRDDIKSNDWYENTCSIVIAKVNETHAGVWKITAYKNKTENATIGNEPESFVFKLYIEQLVSVSARDIEVYEGHYVNVKHQQNYENLKACMLTGPGIEPIDLLTEKQDQFQLFGQCGIHMKVNTTCTGAWKLEAIVDDFVLYYMPFNILTHELKKLDSEDMLTLELTRGSSETIKIPLQVNPEVCQIMDPSGGIVATSYKGCQHTLSVVTVQHEGIWLARYNIRGMLESIDQKFRIKVVDRVTSDANVTYTEDGNSVTLSCRVKSHRKSSSESCKFIRPDGTMFYVTPLVGNERYTAYANMDRRYGRKDEFLECGLIIEDLQDVDYGAWRCDIRIESSKPYGYVLHVDYPDSRKYKYNNVYRRPVKIRTDDVHVKRGNPFTVKCVADAVLKYCWLRSPNGTAYSIAQDEEDVKSPFVLQYTGDGLSFGECEVKISAAENSDHGQWCCFMGVAGGTEATATVSVTVTESYLMAERTEIAVTGRNDPVLSCHILPRTLDRTVHYCRWIRPDGYGIYNDISYRYTTNSSYSQCRLVILNYRPDLDDGRWTCVAGLAGLNNVVEENLSQIDVWRQYDTVRNGVLIGALVGTVALLMMIVGSIAYITVRNRRRRRLLPKNPPAYSPHEHYPPKSLKPKFGTKDCQY